ncbi:MAG: hypothetical protein NXI10_11640 [bacterium]|nr:hypothetical protein [bacterium]
MKPIVRNIIAVVVGWFIGGFVNMSIIQIGFSQYPKDVDVENYEAIGTFLESAGYVYYLYPFMAHAAGALVGGFLAALISKNRKMGTALIIGGLFFLGGVTMTFLLPAPAWFVALDLIVAYFPMALLGAVAAKKLSRKS